MTAATNAATNYVTFYQLFNNDSTAAALNGSNDTEYNFGAPPATAIIGVPTTCASTDDAQVMSISCRFDNITAPGIIYVDQTDTDWLTASNKKVTFKYESGSKINKFEMLDLDIASKDNNLSSLKAIYITREMLRRNLIPTYSGTGSGLRRVNLLYPPLSRLKAGTTAAATNAGIINAAITDFAPNAMINLAHDLAGTPVFSGLSPTFGVDPSMVNGLVAYKVGAEMKFGVSLTTVAPFIIKTGKNDKITAVANTNIANLQTAFAAL